MRVLFFAAAMIFALAPFARAEEMTYFSEPVYQQLNPDDPPPMQDMADLANDGDVRAQYILGNLYAKGQGGLPKDEKLARHWFGQSAALGYFPSFIRLAALAKRRDDKIEALMWYTLASDNMDGEWRKHAKDEIAELTKDKKLTSDEKDQLRKQINVWKSASRDAQRAEAAREKERAKEPVKAQDPAQNKKAQDPAQNVKAQDKDSPQKPSQQETHKS